MLSLTDFYGRFLDNPELTDEVRKNAAVTLAKASELLSRAGIEAKITSGFRPVSYNRQIGGSLNSKHCFGQAIDLSDPDKTLGTWCLHNLEVLMEIGLWMEALSYVDHEGRHCGTLSSDEPEKRWVHLQIIAPRSNNRVFIP